MGIFSKKAGGSFLGNLVRGVSTKVLGFSLTGNPPAADNGGAMPTSNTNSIASQPAIDIGGLIKDTINNVKDAGAQTKTAGTVVTYGIIAGVIIAVIFLIKSMGGRHR